MTRGWLPIVLEHTVVFSSADDRDHPDLNYKDYPEDINQIFIQPQHLFKAQKRCATSIYAQLYRLTELKNTERAQHKHRVGEAIKLLQKSLTISEDRYKIFSYGLIDLICVHIFTFEHSRKAFRDWLSG